MHMLSRKDLNSVELETVRVSRNPTEVITASGEVQTSQEATVYVVGFIRDGAPPRGYTVSSVAGKNCAKITDNPVCGPVVKNHILI